MPGEARRQPRLVFRRPAVGTFLLLLANTVFLGIGAYDESIVANTLALDSRRPALHQFLTFGFLHMSGLHFLLNMAFLLFMGPIVEFAVGRIGLMLAYAFSAAAGAAAFIAFAASDPTAPVGRGAGSAVAGVMGAAIMLMPRDTLLEPGESFARRASEWAGDIGLRIMLLAMAIGLSCLLFMIDDFSSGVDWRMAARLGVAAGTGMIFGASAGWLSSGKHDWGNASHEEEPTARDPVVVIHDRLPSPERDVFDPEPAAEAHSGGYRSPEMRELLAAIETKNATRAFELLHSIPDGQADALLGDHLYWRLGKMLLERNSRGQAVTVLKRQLRAFPYSSRSSLARCELGLIYAEEPETHGQAIAYLREALYPKPAPDQIAGVSAPKAVRGERRAAALAALVELGQEEFREELKLERRAMGKEDTNPDGLFDFEKTFGEAEGAEAAEAPELSADALESQAGVPPRIEESSPPKRFAAAPAADAPTPAPISFDDLSDPAPAPAAQPAARASEPPPADPIPEAGKAQEEESFGAIMDSPAETSERSLSDIFGAAGATSAAIPMDLDSAPPEERLFARMPKAEPDLPALEFDDFQAPEEGRGTGASRTADEPSSGAALPQLADTADDPEPAPEPAPIPGTKTDAPIKLGAYAPPEEDTEIARETLAAAARSLKETGVGDSLGALTPRKPRRLPGSRYAVILPPDRPVLAEAAARILGEQLGLSPKGAAYALKHQHGILAQGLGEAEAERLARRFSAAGQDVLFVEEDELLDFGEPQDALRITRDAAGMRIITERRVIERKWEELAAVSCGQVRLGPSAPPRGVMDLFFQGKAHLRLWSAVFSLAAAEGRGKANFAGDLRVFACEIDRLRPEVTRTRSFSRWMRGSAAEPREDFSSLAEYDAYSRWFLMAYRSRSELIPAATPPRR